MKTLNRILIACNLSLAATVAFAAGPQWTWEAGKQSTGAITLKSTDGSTTYSGTQNPTGAVAKTNQTAVTQPPTVIIQATSGSGSPFGYKDDCYILTVDGYPAQNRFVGAGKLDTATTPNKFTGIMGYDGYSNSTSVISSLTGGSSTAPYKWCGSDAYCAWYYGSGIYGSYYVVGAAALPISAYQRCYP